MYKTPARRPAHEAAAGAVLSRLARGGPAPAAQRPRRIARKTALPRQLHAGSARPLQRGGKTSVAALLRLHPVRALRRHLPARPAPAARAVARSEPLRGRLLALHARAVAPPHTDRAPRQLRHLHRVPADLPARSPAARDLRLHPRQARRRRQGRMTRLPTATARGKALARDLSVLNVQVSCEPPDLWAMSRDCWPRSLLWTKAGVAPHPPDVVVWPTSTDEVVQVVRYAAERRIAVVPFGAGSGVCGGAVPVKGGIALDLKRLSGPPCIDLPARTVDVETGMNGQRLEELLGGAGATLGHFPSSIYCSTIGGWLAARSAGQLSSRYGKIEDIALAVEAVDGTGQVLRTQDAPSAGPDLLQLLLGSEGTLAIVTKARLRCWPSPTSRWMRGLRFGSVQAGIAGLRALMRSGLRPAVARLYDPLDTLLAGRGGGDAHVTVPEPLRWGVGGAQSAALRLALRAPVL